MCGKLLLGRNENQVPVESQLGGGQRVALGQVGIQGPRPNKGGFAESFKLAEPLCAIE